MPARGLQPKGIIRRDKMMLSAVQLFLEKGYTGTTTTDISKMAGMSQASFFAAFGTKESVLLALTKQMFSDQFNAAGNLTEAVKDDPLMLYALECCLQLHIAEYTEQLRDVYVMVYSLPSPLEFIYSSMAPRLSAIFGKYMPEASEKDFYEYDIASAGITRGFMALPCGHNFSMEQKLTRYLECVLRLYHVPDDERMAVTDAVLKAPLHEIAGQLIDDILSKAEEGLSKIMMKTAE